MATSSPDCMTRKPIRAEHTPSTASFSRASVNTIPYFVGGGLSYQGLIPQRGDDIASMGAIDGSFSRHVSGATAETVLEANYQITINRWLSLTPDLQYVIRPSGSGRIGNAMVLGLRSRLYFDPGPARRFSLRAVLTFSDLTLGSRNRDSPSSIVAGALKRIHRSRLLLDQSPI